ncbi:uncharacterized protein [Halyomorpha halys]
MESDEEGAGEVFTISQDFRSDDGISLHRGEKVVLISTKGQDPAKRVRIDSEEVNLGLDIEELLDSSAAKHKMAIRPKRKYEKRNRQNR